MTFDHGMQCDDWTSGPPEVVSGYRFRPSDLHIDDRPPGISAFLRTKNGADFIELTVRSHIEFFDEIVAVFNGCTDRTEEILMGLQREFGREKLRVIHYTDRVYPQGSTGHIETPASSPNSVVNFSNFALAVTKHAVVTKLDDDHVAISDGVAELTNAIRSGEEKVETLLAFSGLNLIRERNGEIAIASRDAVSGSGDIGFFRVSPETYFTHDRRFERFHCGVPREFYGFLYWHMKFLKAGLGFKNYELDTNPDSRFAKRQKRLVNSKSVGMSLADAARALQPGIGKRLAAIASEKLRLVVDRDKSIGEVFPDETLLDAIHRTVAPEFHDEILRSG